MQFVLRRKGLTFPEKCGIIYKSPRESDKQIEKNLPKGLDKFSILCYNVRVAPEERVSNRTPRHLEN